MEKIKYPAPVELSLYQENANDPAAKYGLPNEVAFCKKCVISNQRPNSAVEYQHTKDSKKATINFDANGVCDACNFAKRKNPKCTFVLSFLNIIYWKVMKFLRASLFPKLFIFSLFFFLFIVHFNRKPP